MDIAKEIDKLNSQRDDLLQRLKTPGISEDHSIAILEQCTLILKLINTLQDSLYSKQAEENSAAAPQPQGNTDHLQKLADYVFALIQRQQEEMKIQEWMKSVDSEAKSS